MKRRLIMLLAIPVAVLGIYFGVIAFNPRNYVPDVFSASRLKSAELAQSIVLTSSDLLKSIEIIGRYDQEGNKSQALILISNAVLKRSDFHQSAISLASELEKMARSVPDIRPSQARDFASEAVSSEVALVSQLLSYDDYLQQLFETLKGKVQHPDVYTDGAVQLLIDKINEGGKGINELNNHARASLASFDKIFEK